MRTLKIHLFLLGFLASPLLAEKPPFHVKDPATYNDLQDINNKMGNVVHKTGTETIQGNKYFGGPIPWIDARAYGAIGDGLTNDAPAIQAALNAAAALPHGGRVHLAAGTYNLGSTSLTMTAAHVELFGDVGFMADDSGGFSPTVLTYSGTDAAIIVGSTSTMPTFQHGNMIRNLEIVGSTSSKAGIRFDYTNAATAYTDRWLIENVGVNSFLGTNGIGIHLNGITVQGVIRRCYVVHNTVGIKVDLRAGGDQGTDLHVFETLVRTSTGTAGMWVRGMSGLTIDGQSLFESNYGPGLFIDNVDGGVASVAVKNCRFENNNSGDTLAGYQLQVTSSGGLRIPGLVLESIQFGAGSNPNSSDVSVDYVSKGTISTLQSGTAAPLTQVSFGNNTDGIVLGPMKNLGASVDPTNQAQVSVSSSTTGMLIHNTSGVTLQLDKSTGGSLQFTSGGSNHMQISDSSGDLQFLAGGSTLVATAKNAGNFSFKGTTAGDVAAAGFVGQSTVSAQSTLTNFPTSAQYGDLVSISLTAGDWDISVLIDVFANGATLTGGIVGIGTVSGNDGTGVSLGTTRCDLVLPSAANPWTSASIPRFVVNITGTTTYYLKYKADYTVATPQAVGNISARRIR